MSYAGNTAPAPTAGSDPDLVTITVGTASLSGWQDVRVTRSIEHVPSTFAITLTEEYPSEAQKIVITPGDPCQLKFGNDVVFTGYVDRYTARMSGQEHTISIEGRSKLQDLVDCSAEITSYQVANTTLAGLAQLLCAPFGIEVLTPDGDSAPVPQINVTLTETGYEILETFARAYAFLLYDDVNGDLVIARINDTKMASGFAQGVNVERAEVSYAMDERFTEYDPIYLDTAFLQDGQYGGAPALPFIPGAGAKDNSLPPRADKKPRYRPLLILCEQNANSLQLAATRAQWEAARRYGRSQQISIVADSWRDGAGTLWQPNAQAVVSLPDLKLLNLTWTIATVTYRRDANGTHAEVLLMPPYAFIPQFVILQPFQWQVAQDQPNSGAGNDAPNPTGPFDAYRT